MAAAKESLTAAAAKPCRADDGRYDFYLDQFRQESCRRRGSNRPRLACLRLFLQHVDGVKIRRIKLDRFLVALNRQLFVAAHLISLPETVEGIGGLRVRRSVQFENLDGVAHFMIAVEELISQRVQFRLAEVLERGRFIWPQAQSGTVSLTRAQLSMLLEGIDWRRPQRTQTPELSV